MRCVTPVRLKRRHSSPEIERWSPIASAARMPAAGVAPSVPRNRSRTASRSCSMRSRKLALRSDLLRFGLAPHVAGRADAALEEPRLVVEAVRIHEAVRPAQAHGEEPALAGMHGRGAVVPGDEELLRQPHLGGLRLELEAQARAARRQARDHAHHLEVARLRAPRQAGPTCARAPRRRPTGIRRPGRRRRGRAASRFPWPEARAAAPAHGSEGSAAWSCSSAAPAANATAAGVI